MIFNAISKDGELKVYAKNLFKRFLASNDGKELTLALKKKESQRSIQQNKYYWLVLTLVAADTGSYKESLHKDFQEDFLSYEEETVGIDGQRTIKTRVQSTKDLSTKAFGEYLDKVIRRCEEFGYVIPSPDEADVANYDIGYFLGGFR